MNITSTIRYNIWKSLFNNNLFKLFNYQKEIDEDQLINYSNLQFSDYITPFENDYSNIELYKNILLENKSIGNCDWLCSILLIHLNHFIFDDTIDQISSLNRSFLYEIYRRNRDLFIGLCCYCNKENRVKCKSECIVSVEEILNNSKLTIFFKENKEVYDELEKMKN